MYCNARTTLQQCTTTLVQCHLMCNNVHRKWTMCITFPWCGNNMQHDVTMYVKCTTTNNDVRQDFLHLNVVTMMLGQCYNVVQWCLLISCECTTRVVQWFHNNVQRNLTMRNHVTWCCNNVHICTIVFSYSSVVL